MVVSSYFSTLSLIFKTITLVRSMLNRWKISGDSPMVSIDDGVGMGKW